MRSRLGRIRQLLPFLFLPTLALILFTIEFVRYQQCSSRSISNQSFTSIISYNQSSNIEHEKSIASDLSILCLDMRFRLDNEKFLPLSPIISTPSFNSNILHRLPYRYSQWKSSSILPRLFTPCEHNLVMNLLLVIDQICRDHQIPYFIIGGTLLGSLRHHDIIPWDDDVDVIIPYHQRQLFFHAFEQLNQTLIGLHFVQRKEESEKYYKIFYKHAPSAGGYNWHFPFIDVFFSQRNETHLWSLPVVDFPIPVENIFPLVLRPLGQLWLPAPRYSQRLFDSNVFNVCMTHYWNHRLEESTDEKTVQCSELTNAYPFIEQTNETTSTEVLKLNDTVLHTIVYE